MRTAPKIKGSRRFYDCTFLAGGYDTLEESASVYIFKETWDRLEAAKQHAKERNNGSNQAYTTTLGGMEFQIKPHGGAGVAFILINPYFTISIRPAEIDFNLSVTYRSRTLWEYGAKNARAKAWGILLKEMKPRPRENENEDADICGWRRVSVVHYAFDFHSPEFTGEIGAEMTERIICHSSIKPRWDFKVKTERGEEEEGYIMGTSTRIQTLTVGKKNELEVQIYKKSDEITEKSQKTWMYKIWERAGLEPGPEGKHHDVWRIELRFGRDYLHERGIDEFEDFEGKREALLSEALKNRRLTDRSTDSNRRRWPVHPIWMQAIEMAGNAIELVPLDGHRELSAEVIKEKIVQDVKAALRRYNVLETGGGDYDWATAQNFFSKILLEIEEDENHHEKMEEYCERYKYVYAPM